MLSKDLLDILADERQREVERELRVRALLGRPRRARPLAGIARVIRRRIAAAAGR